MILFLLHSFCLELHKFQLHILCRTARKNTPGAGKNVPSDITMAKAADK